MNLWARMSGLMLLSALTLLISCEDDINSIGLDPENNLGVFFVEVPMKDNIYQLWKDKVNSRASGVMACGGYDDPHFGRITATNYSEVTLTANVGTTIPDNATFDSLVYEIRISGFSGLNYEDQVQSFELYQLAEPIETTDTINNVSIQYHTSTEHPLGQKLSDVLFTLDPDSIGLTWRESKLKVVTEQDSIFKATRFDSDSVYIYQHRFHIDDAFGQSFFNKAKVGSDEFKDGNSFASYFKGLALVPNSNNTAIINYLSNDTHSRLRLYYTQPDGTKNSVEFTVNTSRSFNNITPNETTGIPSALFAGAQPNQRFQTNDDFVYLQSGTNMFLNLDMSGFAHMEDTLSNVLIQGAEIIIRIESVPEDIAITSTIAFAGTTLDSLANGNYAETTIPNQRKTAALVFDADLPGYRIELPFYLELLNNNDFDFDQLMLFPGSINETLSGIFPNPITYTTKKFVANKENINIRLYYTLPERQTTND